jgi:hypothetical protein
MVEDAVSKIDLEAMALNDVGQCMKDLFSGQSDIDESWHELNLSVSTALDLGICPDYILSALINSLPECARQNIMEVLAENLQLPEEYIEEMQAPVD